MSVAWRSLRRDANNLGSLVARKKDSLDKSRWKSDWHSGRGGHLSERKAVKRNRMAGTVSD